MDRIPEIQNMFNNKKKNKGEAASTATSPFLFILHLMEIDHKPLA